MTALQIYASGCAVWSLLLLFAASVSDAAIRRRLKFKAAVLSVAAWPVSLMLLIFRRTA